ncbi:MAG: hypothetical protein AB1656_26580 [Candidatus Omnitrophota bacterium]
MADLLRDFYNIPQIDISVDAVKKLIAIHSADSKTISLTTQKDFKQVLKLERVTAMGVANNVTTNEKSSYYNITIHGNMKIKQATADIDVINQDQITNHFAVALSPESIVQASSYSRFILDTPFCFSIDHRSKPPIVPFPDLFEFEDWDQLLNSLNVGETIEIPFEDVIDLIKPKPTYKVLSNLTHLTGEMRISLGNETIQIDSKSDGVINIVYDMENPQNNVSREFSMIGTLSRNYSIQLNKENPYIVNDLRYESIADYSINHAPMQSIIERIKKVENAESKNE